MGKFGINFSIVINIFLEGYLNNEEFHRINRVEHRISRCNNESEVEKQLIAMTT